MKKIIIIFLFIIAIGFAGCTADQKSDKEIVDEIAKNYCVTYLSNIAGYDVNNDYFVNCYSQTDNEVLPCLCVLSENDNELLSFFLSAETEIGQCQMYREINKQLYGINTVYDKKTVADYNQVIVSINVNDYLYLEKVDSINVDTVFPITEPSQYEMIENAIIPSLILYEIPNGSSITVYEQLNTINLSYDSNKNEIVSTDNEQTYYPVAVNGQLKFVLTLSKNDSTQWSLGEINEDMKWAKPLTDGSKFLVCQNIVINPEETIEITTPVIVKKAYPYLKQLAAKAPSPQILFTFDYNE